MKNIVLVVFLSAFSFSVNAQSKLDSLYSMWEDESLSVEERSSAYLQYVETGFLRPFPDSASRLLDELIFFSKENKNLQYEYKAYALKSTCKRFAGDLKSALRLRENALQIARVMGDSSLQGVTYHGMGTLYSIMQNYPKALECFNKNIAIQEKTGDVVKTAQSLNGIGTIYSIKGNYEKALTNYKKCVSIYEKANRKEAVAHFSANIAELYSNHGKHKQAIEIYGKCLTYRESQNDEYWSISFLVRIGYEHLALKNRDQAVEFATNALNRAIAFENKELLSMCHNMFSKIYQFDGDYRQALNSAELAYKSAEAYQNKIQLGYRLLNYGYLNAKLSNHIESIKNCKQALEYGESTGSISLQLGSCRCLYKRHKTLNNNKEALYFYEKSSQLSASLRETETIEKLQQMEFEEQAYRDSVETKEKELKNELIYQEEIRKEETRRNIVIGFGVFFLLLAGGFYSRWLYTKKSKAEIEEERDRSDNLLLNILPTEIAEELKEKGKAEARDFELVSILFTDFKGFTEQSAKLTAKQLVTEINHCFEAFDGIIEKYNVEKIKTIGDAYMAAGGLPIPSGDSVKNTVLAGLEMQQFISSRKLRMNEEGKPAFEMRVGIHSGPVVAGVVGVKKFQYDVWGDTVNTASRMESNSEVDKVNISQATYEIIKNESLFTFEHRGKVKAKGKGEIDMYFVSKA